jgi:predicted nuclease with TOPRIM domain
MDITGRIANLTAQIADKDEFIGDLDPENPNVRRLEAEKKRLNLMERKLQAQQTALQTRLQEVMQEMQACQQMLGAGIQSGLFSYGMGMGR